MAALPLSVRVVLAVLRREWWVNLRAYRVSFFLGIGLSTMFSLMIGHFLYHEVFHGRITPEFVALAGTDDYISYLAIGLFVYTFAVRMLYPVRDFLVEHWEGTLVVLTMMGMPRLPYHFGCMLFSALYAGVEVLVVAVTAWVFLGVAFTGVNVAGVVAAAVASFIGLFGFSLTLAAVILAIRDRLVVESAAFAAMALLSGVSFPRGYLPHVLQLLGEALPLTHALNALRAAAVEHAGPTDMSGSLLALLALGATYIVVGRALLGWAVRRTVEQTA